MTSEWENSE